DNLSQGASSQAAEDLLRARYIAQGETFLDGLTGCFAVFLHDPARQLTAIARDGMGSQTLSYAIVGKRLFAHQDDAALLAEIGATGELSGLRLAEFFAFEELSGRATFFERLSALLPGEMLLLERGQMRRRWITRPNLGFRIERAHWEDYVEEFAELLSASVLRCLTGLDRVAVLMSGGLDSTPVAAFAARHLAGRGGKSPVTALGWKMSDPRGDETALIRKTADKLGIDLEWIDCDDATPFSNLHDWPVHPSTPEQAAFRWFHQRSYARAAELGHCAVLSGFCGDVLYISGRRWFWDLLSAEGPGRAIDRLREVSADVGWRRALRSHLFGPLLPRMRGLKREMAHYLTPEARLLLAARPHWPPDLDLSRRPRQAERLLALLDGHGANVERYYTEPFGLEQRTPLRDFALVQFMLSVPDHLLQQGTETRPVLRAATRGLIPEEVRLRRDKGAFFDVLDRGMATERLRWTRKLLLDPDALWRGHIEESNIRSWVESSPTDNWGKIGYLHAIYGELWRRERAGLPRPSADAVD
ncbi:MAG: asparagine synthase-related protein, partial [Thermoanaerobaculia bacterium]